MDVQEGCIILMLCQKHLQKKDTQIRGEVNAESEMAH